jgi:6-phospho-beta-glucosidase
VKISVIGGAGVRTPLLVDGLTHSDLPIEEIALYDADDERLGIIGGVAERMSGGARITLCRSIDQCVTGAGFVFTSIRVGGIERRVLDEATAQRHGIVGQETIGPAGFAMAARTIPHMVGYAREINRLAPDAWIVNFTNPVGMVTEAMRTASDRVIGICDTPTELFEEVAHALGVRSDRCHFDYFGLNHLGWLREVYCDGHPQLHRLWGDLQRLRAVYRAPLFDPAELVKLRMLPTEYVYYYDQPQRAFDNVRRAGHTRAQAIAALTDALFERLRESSADAVAVYRTYLRTRSAGYMQIESGSQGGIAAPVAAPSTASELSGYDKIALSVVRAVHFNTNAVIPLSVSNRGTIRDLRTEDVVEVPCVVNANGARPMHVGAVPDSVAPLLARVKDYERRTVAAALAQSMEAAREALSSNPLVPDRPTADRLAADLSPLW